jgi:hypothetical protein
MDVKKFLLKNNKTKQTTLDKAYYKHINCMLYTLNEDEEIRWDTYNLIVENLIKQGGKKILHEIKYRITDGENPSSVILDIANRESDSLDGMVWYLKKRLEEYLEEDFFKRFF